MRKVIISLLTFISVFLFVSVSTVSAKIISNENGTVNIPKTETVDDDLFVGAQAVEIEGVVNGDVFAGAQTIKISGTVNGNLHTGANTIDISGTVKGNVYAGAQNILISGAAIGGSLLTGAATVNIDKETTIGGALLAGAGTLSLDSQVKRSVYAGTGSLTIGANTRIGKDLYYAAGEEAGQANISQSAKIAGNTYKSEIDTSQKREGLEMAKRQLPAFMNSAKIFTSFLSYLGALIIGFLYLKLFGKHFSETSEIVTKSLWKCMGVGFLVTISFIPALILLAITVIGIPVAGIGLLMLLLYMYLAKIVVGSAIGDWLSKRFNWKSSAFGTFAMGLLAIYILRMIPFVGFLTCLAVLWTGLGALTLRTLNTSK